MCGVKPHVLRYWEQEFTQLRPVKRRGNRRYYQHHEVLLIRRIRELLYEQGFTISGARNRLDEHDQGERTSPRAARWLQMTRLRSMETVNTSRPSTSRHCTRNSPQFASCYEASADNANGYTAPLRGVAQPGSALAWGARGREFESRRPDQGFSTQGSRCVLRTHRLLSLAMRILVSNDDGYLAPGLAALADAMRPLGRCHRRRAGTKQQRCQQLTDVAPAADDQSGRKWVYVYQWHAE